MVPGVAINRGSRNRQRLWAQGCQGPRRVGVNGLERAEGDEADVSRKP